MPFADPEGAAVLRDLRESRGLSPESLAAELDRLARENRWPRGTVHAYTIRRAEGIPGRDDRPGRVPGIRVQVALAQYFGVDRREIWKPERRVRVPSDRRPVSA